MKKFILPVLLAVLLISMYAYWQYNRTTESVENQSVDVSITALDLLKAYQTDETAANVKYLDKVIVVSGKVGVITTANKITSVSFDSGDPMSSIICELDPNAKAIGVRMGADLVIKGKCTGFLSDVVLTDCFIQK